MEFRGEYGNAESLALKGLQYMHQAEKSESSYKKAYSYFERALEIDPKDHQSNYYVGLMNMLGYGREQNIPKALQCFEKPGMEKDPRALNAIGYIYHSAPEVFDKDSAKLNLFRGIRKDGQKALKSFKAAARYGSVNAKYNIGSLYLSGDVINDPEDKVEFSFSSAYEYFRQAAEKGHTLAAYNIAIMHFTGLGTYQSCSVASTFIQHVAGVGQHT